MIRRRTPGSDTRSADAGFLESRRTVGPADEALRLQARILGAVGTAIIATDPEGYIVYWNRGAEELYGWLSTEVLGRHVCDVSPAEGAREEAARILSRLARGESWSGDFPVRRKDGTSFLAHVVDTPLFDAEGKLSLIVGASSDVTELRRTEEELSTNRERLRCYAAKQQALTEAALALGACRTVKTLARETAARAGRLLQSRSSATTIIERNGRLVYQRIPPVADGPEGRRRWWEELSRHLLETFERHHRPRRLDRAELETLLRKASLPEEAERLVPRREVVAVPVVTHDGKIAGVIELFDKEPSLYGAEHEDEEVLVQLSQLAAMSLEHIRRYETAERAVRSRDDMLAGVSHDLRNPLSAIITSARLAERTSSENIDALRRQMEITARAAEQMRSLIHDLEEISGLESGNYRMSVQPQDPVDLADDACDMFEAIAGEKDIHLTRYFTEDLPKVLADRDRLGRVFSNLLGNAVKFTPPGGTITVLVEHEGDSVRFSVRDTGPGIDPENLENVFRRYWRSSSGGTGLGLAIARGIVHFHRGSIWAESEPGKGSAFHFTLPVG